MENSRCLAVGFGPALISGCLLFVVFFAARNLEAAVDLFEEDGSHHLVREGHVGEG